MARDLGKKSRKEIGPRRSQNLIHVFGKRSWKEIGPRRSENLIHLFGKRSWKEILERNLGKKLDQEGGTKTESKSNTCVLISS